MKRILVALDSSPRAAQVLAAAARLAELGDAKLVLYRAISVAPELPSAALLDNTARLEDMLIAGARDALSRLVEQVPYAPIEQVITAFAIPWDGICRTAKERDVDLIVVGSHGYSGIDHVLGTVAAKVVNHADRNVLVVRTAL